MARIDVVDIGSNYMVEKRNSEILNDATIYRVLYSVKNQRFIFI